MDFCFEVEVGINLVLTIRKVEVHRYAADRLRRAPLRAPLQPAQDVCARWQDSKRVRMRRVVKVSPPELTLERDQAAGEATRLGIGQRDRAKTVDNRQYAALLPGCKAEDLTA